MQEKETKIIKPLKNEIIRDKIYKMVINKRTEKIVYFDVYNKETNELVGHEIQKIRISKSHPKFVTEFTHVEILCNEKFFGSYGWYFTKFEKERCDKMWEDLTKKY